jgi:hypothetical protein
MDEIRQQLKISKKDGYYVGSERPSLWTGSGDVFFLRRNHLEAAARLALLQDFDVALFDAFCLSLESETKTVGYDRYHALGEWLLRISEGLIRPELSSNSKRGRHSSATILKFRFFVQKVGKAKIWADNPLLFIKLQNKARDYLDEIGNQCEARFKDLCAEPRGNELVTVQPEKQFYETIASQKNTPVVHIHRTFRRLKFTSRFDTPCDSKQNLNQKGESIIRQISQHRVSVINRQDSDEVR